MEILCNSGIPGSGKTLDSTYDAIKHFKKENNPIKKYSIYLLSYLPGKIGENFKIKKAYYKIFPYGLINNVYTNYPVLLDKKRKIYSQKISIFDFYGDNSFYPNALVIFDEIQLYLDSDDYKDKNLNYRIKRIAKVLQSFRHFGGAGVIFNTQHPSRFFKKGRNVASAFVKHDKMFMIPILKVGFIKLTYYFTLEDYGKFVPKDREARKMLQFDFKKQIKFMNFRKLFKSYDSRYLSEYNYNRPLLNKGTWTSLKVEYKDLVDIYEGIY